MGDGEWRSSNFTLNIPDRSNDPRKGYLEIYESALPSPPDFVDESGEPDTIR